VSRLDEPLEDARFSRPRFEITSRSTWRAAKRRAEHDNDSSSSGRDDRNQSRSEVDRWQFPYGTAQIATGQRSWRGRRHSSAVRRRQRTVQSPSQPNAQADVRWLTLRAPQTSAQPSAPRCRHQSRAASVPTDAPDQRSASRSGRLREDAERQVGRGGSLRLRRAAVEYGLPSLCERRSRQRAGGHHDERLGAWFSVRGR
jgi:hypothetical protein